VPSTLILSQRRTNTKVYQCALYEFEDTIAALMGAEVLAPVPVPDAGRWQATARAAGNRLARISGRPRGTRIAVAEEVVDRRYDAFFAAFMYPSQTTVLNHVRGWERAGTKICFLGEVWLRQFEDPQERRQLEVLKEFDHIFLHTSSSLAALAAFTGRPCHPLTVGVDALRFCPGVPAPARAIDVHSMGRRSDVTHRALLAAAARPDFFYLHDTAAGFDVMDAREHRLLLANTIKRSRYFVTYSHNTNIASVTGGQEEIGARLFEGSAGGAILIGSAPDSESFRRHFDWDDAVVTIPIEAGNIAEILAELDAQPERIARARRQNVVNALLRHDWVYRWLGVMETAGLPVPPGVGERIAQLRATADRVLPA
jgi:hypothetical protein